MIDEETTPLNNMFRLEKLRLAKTDQLALQVIEQCKGKIKQGLEITAGLVEVQRELRKILMVCIRRDIIAFDKGVIFQDPNINRSHINGNSFVIDTPWGGCAEVSDATDLPSDYQEQLNRLDFPEIDVSDESVPIEFQGLDHEGSIRVYGRQIGVGADRIAMLVTDLKLKRGFVMYINNINIYRPTEQGGGMSMADQIANVSIKLHVQLKYGQSKELLLNGGFRYLPLIEGIKLFPDDVSRVSKFLAFINPVVSLVPYTLGVLFQHASFDYMKRGAQFNNTELHEGNAAWVLWNKKPKEGFSIPIPCFRWAASKEGGRYLKFGIQWLTYETIGLSYR